MKERIQKVLAAAGVDSRRNIEEMVLSGRITVNDKTVYVLPVLIDPEKDDVLVDGERIRLRDRRAKGSRVYIIMNKPRGVYSTNVAQGEQKRAIDLLPPNAPRVYPVGQLDAESKGLLLLTNDGDLTNRLTHPRYGVTKTYRAIVDGSVEAGAVEELSKGIWLADKDGGGGFKTGKSQIRIVKRMREKSVLEITMREGRNRHIRRMLAKIGHKVKDLTRIKVGTLTLDGLTPGSFRELTPREVKDLQKFARASEKAEADAKPGARGAKPAKPAKNVEVEDDE